MSLEEVGAYTLLLNYDWNEVGLPEELAPFPRWLKVSPRKAQALWDAVRANFALRDGRWYNPRLERERAKQEANRAVRSAAAAKRWHPDGDANEYANALHGQSLPIPIAFPSPDNGTPNPANRLQPTPAEERIFSHYAQRHPRRGPPDDSDIRRVRKALLSFSEERLIQAIDGNFEDEWHRARRKHELSYVFRNNGKISEFIDRYDQANAVVVQNGQLNAEGIRGMAS
jgi:uncharacterized protein YdaU (DUF1376 family)